VCDEFVSSLGLAPNPYASLGEPMDWLGEILDSLLRFNRILASLTDQISLWYAQGYFTGGAGADVEQARKKKKENVLFHFV
jgi:adenylosuccinate lyase